MAILVAMLVGLAVIGIFVGLQMMLSREGTTDRMYAIMQPEADVDLAIDTGGSRLNVASSSRKALKQLDQKLQARGIIERITTNLLQADFRLAATEYILLVLAVTVLGALLGFLISGQLISAIVAGTISFFGPSIFVKVRKAKRRRAFANQLVDVLNQIVGSLRSGYGLVQSLDVVAGQLPAPAGEEFTRVVREVQLGHPLLVALSNLADRIENEDLVMITAAINTNQQVGGNLAEILETVAETIRERVRIKQEIQVMTAQQAISGYILVFMPIALGAVLLIINPTYQMRLFTPGITLCIPSVAALGIVIGFFVMRRIVDIEV